MTQSTLSLYARPPIRIAIGDLPVQDQEMLQISLRVVLSKIASPCEVVREGAADITLRPNGSGIVMEGNGSRYELERPVRLMPLSDSLNDVVQGIVSKDMPAGLTAALEAAAATPEAHAETPQVAAPQNLSSVLHVLLNRSAKVPCRIEFADASYFLVDGAYHSAWSSSPVDALRNGKLEERAHFIQIQGEQLREQTGKGTSLHRISVEQLVWLCTPDEDANRMLASWHTDRTAVVTLETLPNLSQQQDVSKWLRVLAQLHVGPRSLEDLYRTGAQAGLSNDRLRYGISLLLAFGHATLSQAATHTEDAVPAAVAPVKEVERVGMLGRLRARLRALSA